ncbi:hypothetical protein H5410_026084 [Solanum commersonii]|uniref:Helitron helicase-like domain-containing protein n=1 Tax=Solanum commersonii TaxID=4109 RepID=A0A9J5YXQ3_SOLCO|nr:hypothetical protein H5410_026084 [Solanum commersonii]
MEENRDDVFVQERTFDRNSHRRARYAQMSPERKELFLSHLREKKGSIEKTKNPSSINSTPALTINTSSFSPQQGSEATNLAITSTRGERIVNCLSTFKVGSTSTASHVASKLTSRRTANRGMLLSTIVIKIHVFSCLYITNHLFLPCTSRNKLQVNLQNDNLLPKDYLLLKKVPNCKFCAAKRFQYESPGFCCDNGSIRLTSHNMPTELRNLFLGDSKECQHFRTYSIAYNNMFAFTSLEVHYDRELAKRNRGIYTFKVQGQMYHFIDLIPSTGKGKNLQLYFYDNENELTNRMTLADNLNELIVTKLMDILKHNPYSTFLRSTHNLPTASEVGAIWIEDELNYQIPTPHIRIYTHSNRSQLVNYYYGCYDPLQYPLLFPYDQNG